MSEIERRLTFSGQAEARRLLSDRNRARADWWLSFAGFWWGVAGAAFSFAAMGDGAAWWVRYAASGACLMAALLAALQLRPRD